LQVAFDHWQGEAYGRDSDTSFVVEGVDMILFTGEGKISTLVQFDMQVGHVMSVDSLHKNRHGLSELRCIQAGGRSQIACDWNLH
jgi:hypothetical protein